VRAAVGLVQPHEDRVADGVDGAGQRLAGEWRCPLTKPGRPAAGQVDDAVATGVPRLVDLPSAVIAVLGPGYPPRRAARRRPEGQTVAFFSRMRGPMVVMSPDPPILAA